MNIKSFSFDFIDILKIDTEGFEFDVIKEQRYFKKQNLFILNIILIQ